LSSGAASIRRGRASSRGPADRAGIREGDVLLLDGHRSSARPATARSWPRAGPRGAPVPEGRRDSRRRRSRRGRRPRLGGGDQTGRPSTAATIGRHVTASCPASTPSCGLQHPHPGFRPQAAIAVRRERPVLHRHAHSALSAACRRGVRWLLQVAMAGLGPLGLLQVVVRPGGRDCWYRSWRGTGGRTGVLFATRQDDQGGFPDILRSSRWAAHDPLTPSIALARFAHDAGPGLCRTRGPMGRPRGIGMGAPSASPKSGSGSSSGPASRPDSPPPATRRSAPRCSSSKSSSILQHGVLGPRSSPPRSRRSSRACCGSQADLRAGGQYALVSAGRGPYLVLGF
jgi:hypothetical protein